MPTSVVAAAIYLYEAYQTYAVVAFAVNMVASAIISKAFFSPSGYDLSGQSPNPGNRQQIPPATDNKLPVVYGNAWLGGTVVDLSISENNQEMYYVMALSEVTGNGNDVITFGDIYYGGKKVVFKSDGYTVDYLVDESNGSQDTNVSGKIQIYLYRDGSQTPTNSTISAIQVMQSSGLIYKWDNNKLMTNCAFAIIHLTYNADAGITGLQQTKFNLINSRTDTGDCLYDYLTNTTYGCAIPTSQVNTTSLNALTAYCNQLIPYNYLGMVYTQKRFQFNGVLDTQRTCMQNLQDMISCCDALLSYNEITAQWGVIVQQPTYTVVMDLNDSNIISAIQVTPLDIASSYNVIEVKFPDKTSQDAFNSATFDLAQLDPSLLYPNEPVNKMSVSLPYINNSVSAQLLANRFLKAGREDLQLQFNINYVGIQLQAGDIVSVTNANYGWTAKPFRVNKVIETFTDDGNITAKLTLSEFNATVYSDISITAFDPSPNTGISDPTIFGTIPAPLLQAQYPSNANPFFVYSVTASSRGIIQYAEVWYSAYSNPTPAQMFFAGTTAINADGTPYAPSSSMGSVSLADIPAGNWYFFTRMVNSLATSPYSPASLLFRWRPSTYQFTERYLNVAYADNNTGTSNFSLTETNRLYYGLFNSSAINASLNPSDYTWYLADPAFGTAYHLCYANRQDRKFSFATGLADYASGSGAFVPTQTTIFDPSLWSALQTGVQYIDLDYRTGQLLETGTTTVGTGEIAITNSSDGRIVASLQQFLDFGTGVYTYTGSASTLTIDIYGRVVGFTTPDSFYYTEQSFTASSGQTVFTVTRGAGYIANQCLVFKNGLLLDESEYTDTSGSTGTVTLATGATAGDIISIVSMKSSNSSTGVYASFTRNQVTLTNASSYTPSFTLTSGFELLFLNGTIVNEQDYDIIGGSITNFPSLATGDLTIIQWSANNLSVPNGTPVNVITNTIVGQTIYPFSYNANAFNLYENGVLLLQGTDYTTATGSYTLSNSPDTIQTVLLQQTFARTGAV